MVMNEEATKLRQAMHDNERRQLSLGRIAQEIRSPKDLKALKREQAVLSREIIELKENIAKIENA